MLEDKLRSTDWEATYEAIEEAVARESYLTWLREQEKRTGTSRQGLQVGGERKEGRGRRQRCSTVFLLCCFHVIKVLWIYLKYEGLHLKDETNSYACCLKIKVNLL